MEIVKEFLSLYAPDTVVYNLLHCECKTPRGTLLNFVRLSPETLVLIP